MAGFALRLSGETLREYLARCGVAATRITIRWTSGGYYRWEIAE